MTLPIPDSASSTGGRLVTADDRLLPLQQTRLDVDAAGGLARVRVRQTFHNPSGDPLEVTYQLPLPADAAVVGLSFVLGDERVTGRVQTRADAREAFEQAVLEGRTASLLEQVRSSVFTQTLGNVPPGAQVIVELEVEQPLAWEQGGWAWRFPTVVAPRYLGAPGESPDASALVVDVAEPFTPPSCDVRMAIADRCTAPPSSPTHALRGEGADLALEGVLDRDVVVRWAVAAPAPGATLELAHPSEEGDVFGLLTVVPPETVAASVPRDLILLLDVSGSMAGVPLDQLKAFCRALIGGLGPSDQLEMIAFAGRARRFLRSPVRVDDRARAKALAWVQGLTAGGGTRMHDGIYEALRPLRAEASRQVVVVTDGLIGFEHEVVATILRDLPAGCQVHTVGIGAAPNRSLTRAAARAGRGHEALVGPDEPVEPAVEGLLARTCRPLGVGLELTGPTVVDWAPRAIPDLSAGAPTRIAVRLRAAAGPHALTLGGTGAAGAAFRATASARVPDGGGRRVVATRYARERVADLELGIAAGEPRRPLQAEIERLGLVHQIATSQTSWVAATAASTVDAGAPSRRARMPQPLPYATSAEGVGLRAMAATPAALASSRAAGGLGRRRKASRAMRGPIPPPGAPRPEAPVRGLREEAEADDFDALELEAPRERPGRVRLRATVRRRADGKLVLEVVLDQPLAWGPDDGVAVLVGGRWTATEPLEGTTKAGSLVAGQVARLVVADGPTLPAMVRVGDVELELG